MSPRSRDLISSAPNGHTDYTSSSKDEYRSLKAPGTAPPAYTSTNILSFATVSLHMTDRIRFLQFPDHDLPRLVDIVATSWSTGIQGTRQYAGSFEIKLKGNPWVDIPSAGGITENQAKRLIRRLLEGLYNLGWIFDVSVRACKKQSEKDTMIFMKYSRRPIPPPCSWLMISYDNFNMLTIQCGPADLVESISLGLGKLVTNTLTDDSCTKLTLHGHPWSSVGKETMKVREMLLIVRESLERCGFEIYASLTMMGASGRGETDVLVCNSKVEVNECRDLLRG